MLLLSSANKISSRPSPSSSSSSSCAISDLFLYPLECSLGSYHNLTLPNNVLESFDINNCMQWEPFVESASILQKVDDNLSIKM
jgi:hypothetical protein